MVIIKKLTLVFCVTFIFGGCECLEPMAPVNTTPSYRANLYLSRTRGQTNKYFSSHMTCRSNFITKLTVIRATGLPPGVTLNTSRNMLEGTPTLAGFYNVEIRYRDKYKGAHGHGKTGYYYHNYEIKIFDKLGDER